MPKKTSQSHPIDPRVLESPPRKKLIEGFGVYPLSDEQRQRRVRQVSQNAYEFLRDGTATVARVTRHDSGWEDGYEAGPYYKVEYAFEDESGTVREDTCGGSFDGMHLAYGGNEWTKFLADVCAGTITEFTILYNDRDSSPVACLFS